MSCITEILKIKGDQDVLLHTRSDGKVITALEGGGTYKDYEYLVVLSHMGHRCGYVAIPLGHPANELGERENIFTKKSELDYMELNIPCHGGLTFGSKEHPLKDLLQTPCNDYWIGFDCGHHGDSSDFECLDKYYGKERTEYIEETLRLISQLGTVKPYAYAELECKDIIDQLILMEKAA